MYGQAASMGPVRVFGAHYGAGRALRMLLHISRIRHACYEVTHHHLPMIALIPSLFLDMQRPNANCSYHII